VQAGFASPVTVGDTSSIAENLDLSGSERELIEAARIGAREAVDFRDAEGGDGENVADGGAWGPSRTVRAAVLTRIHRFDGLEGVMPPAERLGGRWGGR
jgi:hypothetical protein